MNTEQLQIQTAILKAVRNISELAFSEKLGNSFSLIYTVHDTISMMLTYDGLFCSPFEFQGMKLGTCIIPLPCSVDEIHAFEVKVQQARDDVCDYVEGNK